MHLTTFEPDSFSDETIADEIATALLTIECGLDAVSTGDYESVSTERTNAKARHIQENPDSYQLYRDFRVWRDYALRGVYQPDIPNPHDGYALVLMSAPGVELYGTSHATNCSAILQAMVAREKIDLAKGRKTPGFVAEGAFLDFSIGGKHEGLTIFELSLLAKMSVQSVRNELRKAECAHPKIVESGLVTIPATSAHEWLLARRGFIDTFASDTREDELLVPQAKDGSVFSVQCRQGSGFKIGKKGEEIYYENYMDALKALAQMKKAYWRRPSPKSAVPGIVSAATWVKKARNELGLT